MPSDKFIVLQVPHALNFKKYIYQLSPISFPTLNVRTGKNIFIKVEAANARSG